MSASDVPSSVFLFNSEEGIKICREIAQPSLGYDPHDYSLDIATKIIDGKDCLVRAACGSGKTGILALLALVMVKLGENPGMIPPNCPMRFCDRPVILVICPTNALKVDLVREIDISIERHSDLPK